MESKLKALKVVELKEILQKANVTIPAKANKPDLIAKIIDSPEALEVFNEITGGQAKASPAPVATPKPAGAPAPPPVAEPDQPTVPSSLEAVSVAKEPEPTKQETSNVAEAAPTAPLVSSASILEVSSDESQQAAATETTITAAESKAAETVDPELERRRKRAERFGIPLVEKPIPRAPAKLKANGKGPAIAQPATSTQDVEALRQRAERFGIKTTAHGAAAVTPNAAAADAKTGGKRAAQTTETVDAEEAERRQKRAERFGLKV